MKEKILGLIAGYLLKHYYLIFIRFEERFENPRDKEKFFKAFEKPIPKKDKLIIAFFHQDELALIPYFINKNIAVLVSPSKDGEIMCSAIDYLGYQSVRGSSNKKPVAGLLAAIKKTLKGYNFAMAVDGPKGPIYKVKEGVIKISEKAQTQIIPIRAELSRFYLFKKAWNQARLPMPFSKVIVHIGSIDFYTKETLEEKIISLE